MRGGRQALLVKHFRAMVALLLIFTSAVASHGHAACPHGTMRAQATAAHDLVDVEHREVGHHLQLALPLPRKSMT